MAFLTPKGLKLTLDLDGVERVVAPAAPYVSIGRAALDAELWASFPSALSNAATVLAFVITRSAASTVAAGSSHSWSVSSFTRVHTRPFCGSWFHRCWVIGSLLSPQPRLSGTGSTRQPVSGWLYFLVPWYWRTGSGSARFSRSRYCR